MPMARATIPRMAPPVSISPLSRLPTMAVIHAINEAYADYFIPIRLTPYSFEEIIERESVDTASSVVALSGDLIVGMGLLGARGSRGWIGGMGVIPSMRGQGIGRRMMVALLENARSRGIEGIRLEAIDQNVVARTLYRSLGFQETRRLLLLNRAENAPVPVGPLPPADIAIEERPAAALLEPLQGFPSPDRPWQREPDSIRLLLEQIRGLAAFHQANGEVCGVCLYAGDTYGIGVIDLAARHPSLLAPLVTALIARYPSAYYTYLNIADLDPALPALLTAGFTESLVQHEMYLSLQGQSTG